MALCWVSGLGPGPGLGTTGHCHIQLEQPLLTFLNYFYPTSWQPGTVHVQLKPILEVPRGAVAAPTLLTPSHTLEHHVEVLLQECRRLDSCSRSAVPAPAGISKAEVKQRWHHHLFCLPDSPQVFLMPQQPLLAAAASPQRPGIQFLSVSQAMLSLLSTCSAAIHASNHPHFPSTQTPHEAPGNGNPTCTHVDIHQ